MGFQQRRYPLWTTAATAAAEVGVDQTQDVQGTAALGRSARSVWTTAVLATGLLYFSPASSGAAVLQTQPDSLTQAVHGDNNLGTKQLAWQRRAQAQSRFYQTTAQVLT